VLPDKGKRLYDNIERQEKEIETLKLELENMPAQNSDINETEMIKQSVQEKKEPLFTKGELYSHLNIDDMPMKPVTFPECKELGKKAQETRNEQIVLTTERLQDMHNSLTSRPPEDKRAKDPKGLKVKLMPHQQYALAWLLWREQQRPSGGVLGI